MAENKIGLSAHYGAALLESPASEHFDVMVGEERVGRLYMFDAREPELVSQGILKQWFLTHQQGDCLICGHVKDSQQWSLCQPHSLEPTSQYFLPEDLLAFVFSPDYVQSVSQGLRVDAVANSVLTQNGEISNQPETTNTTANSMPGETGNGQKVKVSPALEISQLITQDFTAIALPTLEEQLSALSQSSSGSAEEGDETESVEDKSGSDETPNLAQLPEKETARQQWQQQLAILLIEGDRSRLLDFEKQDLESLWQLAKDEDVISLRAPRSGSLRDRSDSHVVMAVNSRGEVLSPLSAEDAQAIESQLQHPSPKAQSQKPSIEIDKLKGWELE